MSHIIDLDVDKVLEKAQPLCSRFNQYPPGRHDVFQYPGNSSDKPPQKQNRSVNANVKEILPPPKDQWLSDWCQSASWQHIAPDLHPGNVLTYQCSGMPVMTRTSVWDPSMEFQSSEQRPRHGREYGRTFHPQPALGYTGLYAHSDVQLSFVDGFAWPSVPKAWTLGFGEGARCDPGAT